MTVSGKLSGQSAFWQVPDTLNEARLRGVTAVGAVSLTGALVGLNYLWYADHPRTSFHFFNDNADWLQMDKAGHVATAYQLSRIGFESVRWTGADRKRAALAGTGYSLLFLTGIEVLDGFSEAWGFSPGDAAANLAGAALFIGQEFGWEEQRIQVKFSYAPSGSAPYRPETLGANDAERIIKDYNGQTYWLSVNPGSFRSDGARILPWLNVALGYGADGMLGGSENPETNAAGAPLPDFERYRRFFLSLDVDLTKIHVRSGFLNAFLGAFGFIKIPAPALEYSRGGLHWHWIYF